MKAGFDATKHVLVPKHAKATEKEVKELFAKYSIAAQQLPRILINDTAIKHLNVSEGDIIKIIRSSPTAGETVFFRRVVNS